MAPCRKPRGACSPHCSQASVLDAWRGVSLAVVEYFASLIYWCMYIYIYMYVCSCLSTLSHRKNIYLLSALGYSDGIWAPDPRCGLFRRIMVMPPPCAIRIKTLTPTRPEPRCNWFSKTSKLRQSALILGASSMTEWHHDVMSCNSLLLEPKLHDAKWITWAASNLTC